MRSLASPPPAVRPWLSRQFSARAWGQAWAAAFFLSGAPSTLWAALSGSDLREATYAAGAMLVAADSPAWQLWLAAGVAHGSVSTFWAWVLGQTLPRRRTLAWALLASAAIAWLDLKLIAPLAFPSITALAFWPQFADHLMWGLCLGLPLARDARRTIVRTSS